MKVFQEFVLKAGDALNLNILLQFSEPVFVDTQEIENVAKDAIRKFLIEKRNLTKLKEKK